MMFLRRAASNFLKGIRFSSNSSASRRSTPRSFSEEITEKLNRTGYGSNSRTGDYTDPRLWIILSGQTALISGLVKPVLAENVPAETISGNVAEGDDLSGLKKIEDGSVVSNIHTSKWRVFTDSGRDYFVQGKHAEAEKLFLSALQEAKEGFGDRDPHVASACSNLAEFYRITKAFSKAEPLYLEAVNILEESYGPEDIRIGVAFHNMGQFYLVQRRLEEAAVYYERASKIKKRVLGHSHSDYANTLYHLGTVLYLQGKEIDAEALIQESIKILEGDGQGESDTCVRRLRYLSQIYLKANRPLDAENIQRKILHILEVSKKLNSLETVFAAESLALTLQATGKLREAHELLVRCLDARKTLLPEDHIQIGANMLHLARVSMLDFEVRKMHGAEEIAELDKTKDLLKNSIRISQKVLNKLIKSGGTKQNLKVLTETRKNANVAFAILLQSYDSLGLLEITKKKLQESQKETFQEAEDAFALCISAYRKLGTERLLKDSVEAKSNYLSCLKNLSSLTHSFKGTTLQVEIEQVEGELSSYKRHEPSN